MLYSNNSKIFISRVSRELGTHAEQLRNDLQGLVESKVLTQVSFRQEPDTEPTLQKLSKGTTGVRLSIIRVHSWFQHLGDSHRKGPIAVSTRFTGTVRSSLKMLSLVF